MTREVKLIAEQTERKKREKLTDIKFTLHHGGIPPAAPPRRWLHWSWNNRKPDEKAVRTRFAWIKTYKVVGGQYNDAAQKRNLGVVSSVWDHNRRKRRGGTTGRIHTRATVLKQRHGQVPVFSCLHAASRVSYVSEKSTKKRRKFAPILEVYRRFPINRVNELVFLSDVRSQFKSIEPRLDPLLAGIV